MLTVQPCLYTFAKYACIILRMYINMSRAPRNEQRQLRSSEKHEVRLCEWRELNCEVECGLHNFANVYKHEQSAEKQAKAAAKQRKARSAFLRMARAEL